MGCGDYFRYRCDWRSRTSRPGNHRSALSGSGFEIRENTLMRLGEDPRRLALQCSARDPLQRLWVSRMQHVNTATVTVLADVSASMAVRARADKRQMLLQFIQATVRSASTYGDRFALHCADQHYLPALNLAARRCAHLPRDLAERLRQHKPSGEGAYGLLGAAEKLGPRRGLVFLVSDFFWPLELIKSLSETLRHMQLVPVMLCDSGDLRQQRNLLSVYRDAESGRQKLRFQLPWQRDQSPVAVHRAQVVDAFSARGIEVLELEDGFDANLVSAYFYS